jgi:hypothetical protein
MKLASMPEAHQGLLAKFAKDDIRLANAEGQDVTLELTISCSMLLSNAR